MAEETFFLEFMGAIKNSVNGEVTIACLTRNGRKEIRRLVQALGLELRAPSDTTVIISPNDENRFRVEIPSNGQGRKDCRNNLKRLAEALKEETHITRLVIRKAPADSKASKRKRGRKYKNTHGQFR